MRGTRFWTWGMAAITAAVLASSVQAEPIQMICRVMSICRSERCQATEDRTIFLTRTAQGTQVEVGPDYSFFRPELTYSTTQKIGIRKYRGTLLLKDANGASARMELNVDRAEIPLGDGSFRTLSEGQLVRPSAPKDGAEIIEEASCDYVMDYARGLSGMVWGVFRTDDLANSFAKNGFADVFFHCAMTPIGKVSDPEHQRYGWDLWMYQEDPDHPDYASPATVKTDAIWGAPLQRGRNRDVIADPDAGFRMIVQRDGSALVTLSKGFGSGRYSGTCERGPAY